MKQKELIELVQQHHPHILEKEARILLNRASDDICSQSEIFDTSYKDVSITGQRYYFLGNTILKIRRVDVEDKLVPRLQGQLEETDLT
jgi:hypothetical protein